MPDSLVTWLNIAIERDLERVLNGRIPRQRRNTNRISDSYWYEDGSAIHVVRQNRDPEVVNVSRFHSQERPVPSGVISDLSNSVYARFSGEAINNNQQVFRNGGPIVGTKLTLSRFEITVSRYGDLKQRVSLLVHDCSPSAQKAAGFGTPVLICNSLKVRELVTEMFSKDWTARGRQHQIDSGSEQAPVDADDGTETPASQASDPPFMSQSQMPFATQVNPTRRDWSSSGAGQGGSGGVNTSGPMEAKRFASANGRRPSNTPTRRSHQDQLLDILSKPNVGAHKAQHSTNKQSERSEDPEIPEVLEDTGKKNMVEDQAREDQEVKDYHAQGLLSSTGVYAGNFQFTKPLQGRLQVPESQAKLLERADSWRPGEPGVKLAGLNIPRETLVTIRSSDRYDDTNPIAKRASQSEPDIIDIRSVSDEASDNGTSGDSGSSSSLLEWPESVGGSQEQLNNQLPPDSSAEETKSPRDQIVGVSASSGPTGKSVPSIASASGNGSSPSKARSGNQMQARPSPPEAQSASDANHGGQKADQTDGPKSNAIDTPSRRPDVSVSRSQDLSSNWSVHDSEYNNSGPSKAVNEHTEVQAHSSTDFQAPDHHAANLQRSAPDSSYSRHHGGENWSVSKSPRYTVAVDGGSDYIDDRMLREHPPKRPFDWDHTPTSDAGVAYRGRGNSEHHSTPTSQAIEPPHKKLRTMGALAHQEVVEDPKMLAKRQKGDFIREKHAAQHQEQDRPNPVISPSGQAMFDARGVLSSASLIAGAKSVATSRTPQLTSQIRQGLGSGPTRTEDLHPGSNIHGAQRNESVGISDPTTAPGLFTRFQIMYPMYDGDLKHFLGLCRTIDRMSKDKRLHRSLWDDFVVRHKTHYIPYARRINEEGEEAKSYPDYFDESFDDPVYLQKVLNFDTLSSVVGVEGSGVNAVSKDVAKTASASAKDAERRKPDDSSSTTLNDPKLPARPASPSAWRIPGNTAVAAAAASTPGSDQRQSLPRPSSGPSTPHNKRYGQGPQTSSRVPSGPRGGSQLHDPTPHSRHTPSAVPHYSPATSRFRRQDATHATTPSLSRSWNGPPPTTQPSPSSQRLRQPDDRRSSYNAPSGSRGQPASQESFRRSAGAAVAKPAPPSGPAGGAPYPSQKPPSTSRPRSREAIATDLSSDESITHIRTSQIRESQDDSVVGGQWWQTDDTVFKEWARSFKGLKIFGGDLVEYGGVQTSVLDWQL